MEKQKINYVSLVLEDMVRHKSKAIIEELPLLVEDDKQGKIEITYRATVNGVKIRGTAENEKEAKRRCYEKIFKENLHLMPPL